MSNIWFTSDTHFGHNAIIRFSNRPFSSVEDMDETLIQRWNERVKPNDLIWHLGDFAFHKTPTQLEELFNRLNGTKCLITGNHDHNDTRRLPWTIIKALTTIGFDKKLPIVLCHYGMRVWDRSHHGSLHLYGHSHNTLPGNNQSLDVGVDCWDYRPINIDEIRGRMKTLPIRPKEF
jgi:calcineurin-like phosphoesterase family protein